MSRYEELKHLIPPRLQLVIQNAKRFPDQRTVNVALYWYRRHERDVRDQRAKVDARIAKRTAEYQARGQNPQSLGFVTTAMRENLELLYSLESGLAAALAEIQALQEKVGSHGA